MQPGVFEFGFRAGVGLIPEVQSAPLSKLAKLGSITKLENQPDRHPRQNVQILFTAWPSGISHGLARLVTER